MRFSRIGIEIVAQPDICGEAAVHSDEVLGESRCESFTISAVRISVGGTNADIRQRCAFKEELQSRIVAGCLQPVRGQILEVIQSVDTEIQRPVQIESSELRADFQGMTANRTRKLVLDLKNGRKIA